MATFRVVRVDLLATRLFKLRSRSEINLREKARNMYAKTSRQIDRRTATSSASQRQGTRTHQKHAKTKRVLSAGLSVQIQSDAFVTEHSLSKTKTTTYQCYDFPPGAKYINTCRPRYLGIPEIPSCRNLI
jgi:hypothetical protein